MYNLNQINYDLNMYYLETHYNHTENFYLINLIRIL